MAAGPCYHHIVESHHEHLQFAIVAAALILCAMVTQGDKPSQLHIQASFLGIEEAFYGIIGT